MIKKLGVLVLALLLICSLAGCGSKDEEMIRQTIDGFCGAMQKMDMEAMGDYIVDDSQTMSTETDSELEKLIYEQLAKWDAEMTYTIDAVDIEKTKAAVTITCKYVDAAPVFIETVDAYKQEMGALLTGGGANNAEKKDAAEIYKEILQEKIATVATESASQKIHLSLTKSNSQWKIDSFPKEAANILICNFMEAYGNR